MWDHRSKVKGSELALCKHPESTHVTESPLLISNKAANQDPVYTVSCGSPRVREPKSTGQGISKASLVKKGQHELFPLRKGNALGLDPL